MNLSKRFKRELSSLEQLPNELLVEIFGYLTGIDTVYAFCQLNNRFQNLLLNYVNDFDFKSINKAKFDYIIQNHDISYWRSLCLSDDDKTPGQIKLFCQLYPPSQYLSQLQTLSLLNMDYEFNTDIFFQSGSFNQLVSLTIGDVCGKDMPDFQLPSLKRLVVVGCNHTNWLMNFPRLEKLKYTIKLMCIHKYVITFPTTLNELNLVYTESVYGNDIRTSLHHLSQLTKLSMYNQESHGSLPNGEIWEELIKSSLPLLRIFQFCFSFRSYDSTSNMIKNVVASFSTPFYLLEKRWFIRCDFDYRYGIEGTIYTLPFVFTEMPISCISFDSSMSTLITDDIDKRKYHSYGKIKTLLFNEKCQTPSREFLSTSINRLVLQTALPASWYFLLGNLRHVVFCRNLHMLSEDFANFLANTPKLQSLSLSILALTILTDKFSNKTVCNILSEQIQSLIISRHCPGGDRLGGVPVRQLNHIVRIFNQSCRHLSLGIAAHPNTILPILRRMRKLHSLHISYHPWNHESDQTAEFWLTNPPIIVHECDFMHVANECDFYVWFGNRY